MKIARRIISGAIRGLRRVILFALPILSLGACQTLPDDAFRLSESALELREIQTRDYEGVSDTHILTASTAVLQDLGYSIDEIEGELGVISASKRADATNPAEVMGMVALDIFDCVFTILLGCENDSYESTKDVQDIKLTLVVLPDLSHEGSWMVRITIQRVIWERSGKLHEQETVTDAEVYRAFFEKLHQSVFLEQEGL